MTHELHDALLGWFGREQRCLAWRTTSDPYEILVSEVMLQQTQAARVEPLWRAFLERFPTVHVLAAATPGAVVTAWRGLGYNRRAVNLRDAAQVIVDTHGGRVPDDLDSLKALPGVGDYTARAVLAFAYGRDVAPVDTNVARVLARAVAGKPLGRVEGQRLAEACLPPRRAKDWNGALMDLGATICTARSPACGVCPINTRCAWRGGGESADPAAGSTVRSRPQEAFAGSVRYHRGRLVDALRRGTLDAGDVARAAGLEDTERAAGIASGLVADGLAVWRGGRLCLPEG